MTGRRRLLDNDDAALAAQRLITGDSRRPDLEVAKAGARKASTKAAPKADALKADAIAIGAILGASLFLVAALL